MPRTEVNSARSPSAGFEPTMTRVVDPSGAVATLWDSFGLPVLVIVITRHHWRHAKRRNSLVVVVDPGPAVDRGHGDAPGPPRSPDPPRRCDERGGCEDCGAR